MERGRLWSSAEGGYRRGQGFGTGIEEDER